MKDHWSLHAERWHLIGAPLRPSCEDVGIVRKIVDDWRIKYDREPHVVVLGVTPELVRAFPMVTAIDNETAMIEAHFQERIGHRIIQADWRAIPLEDASADIILGDGVTSIIGYPDDYRVLASELGRLLSPDGLVALRFFASPEIKESLDHIAADLNANTIGSFHVLKWRIAMAIPTDDQRIKSAAIREAFDVMVPDRAALAARTGWARDVIDNIDIYRNSGAVRAYPPVSVVRAAFAPLRERGVHAKSYELGDRCPTIVFSH